MVFLPPLIAVLASAIVFTLMSFVTLSIAPNDGAAAAAVPTLGIGAGQTARLRDSARWSARWPADAGPGYQSASVSPAPATGEPVGVCVRLHGYHSAAVRGVASPRPQLAITIPVAIGSRQVRQARPAPVLRPILSTPPARDASIHGYDEARNCVQDALLQQAGS